VNELSRKQPSLAGHNEDHKASIFSVPSTFGILLGALFSLME
jgi:hypothetical protein